MAWHDDSVPDGIGDDPPVVAGSQQGGTRVNFKQMGQSAFCFFFLHPFC